MVKLIPADRTNEEFETFLARLRETGCSYEGVVEEGRIVRLYVRIPDDGKKRNLQFGRIIGSKMVSYIETVYLPRIVDGKFIYNYNGKNK